MSSELRNIKKHLREAAGLAPKPYKQEQRYLKRKSKKSRETGGIMGGLSMLIGGPAK